MIPYFFEVIELLYLFTIAMFLLTYPLVFVFVCVFDPSDASLCFDHHMFSLKFADTFGVVAISLLASIRVFGVTSTTVPSSLSH